MSQPHPRLRPEQLRNPGDRGGVIQNLGVCFNWMLTAFGLSHATARDQFDRGIVSDPLELAGIFRRRHEEPVTITDDPDRGRYCDARLAKGGEEQKALVAEGEEIVGHGVSM